MVVVALPSASDDDVIPMAAALARSLPALYNRKSTAQTAEKVSVKVLFCNSSDGGYIVSADSIAKASALVTSIRQAADLIDRPCSELHATAFVNEAKALCAGLSGVTCEVIQGEELRQRGMGCIYGVGKAAEHPPALVILTYLPEGKQVGDAGAPVLVGKGIVYDTGGLSLKTSEGMPVSVLIMHSRGNTLHY